MPSSHIPKAVLYHFVPGSVWASVPVLTALEKGFTEVQLEQRLVNLFKGENFSPSFLKISPNGTVPALVVPYSHTTDPTIPTRFRALTTTVEICAFLDASTLPVGHSAPTLSPATVQGNSESNFFIEHVHKEDAPDPNFFMLSARSDEERKAKFDGGVGTLLEGRQEALERYSKEAGDTDQRLAAFYGRKIQENGGLLAVYKGEADATGFYELSKKAWDDLGKTIELFETRLSDSTYAIGDQISLADMHLAGYFARILAAAGYGGKDLQLAPAIAALEAGLGEVKVGPNLTKYLTALWERPSFKEVYKGGLH